MKLFSSPTSLLVGLLLLAGGFTFPVQAAEQRTVKIAAFNYYPAIFQDNSGRVQGFYVDFIDEIAKRERWRVEYVYGSWADGLQRVQSGEVDLLTSVAHTPERENYMSFGRVPLLTVWGDVYVPGDSPIDSILELSGKTVAVMKGDFNGTSLVELAAKFGVKCDFVELKYFDEIFAAVRDHKVDAGVVNNTYGAARQHDYGLKSSGIVFNPFDIYFAAAKGKNGELLGTLDRYLEKWRKDANSPYHQARQHWAHGTASAVRVTPQALLIALAVLAVAAALGGIFVSVLRLQVRRAVADLKQREARLEESRGRYCALFENSPVALCEEDFSGINRLLDTLRRSGVSDLESYLRQHPQTVALCLRKLIIFDVNQAMLRLFGAPDKETLLADPGRILTDDASRGAFAQTLGVLWRGESADTFDCVLQTLQGKKVHVMLQWQVLPGEANDYSRILVSMVDITRRKEMEDALRVLAEGTVRQGDEDYLNAFVRNLAGALGTRYALFGRLSDDGRSIQTLAFCEHGRIVPNFSYVLLGTPCERVVRAPGVISFAERLQDIFPADHDLERLQAESYRGIALRDAAGRTIGILCVMDDQPMTEGEEAEQMLRIFGARAAVDLDRMKSEAALRASEERFRSSFEHAGIGMALSDREGRITQANPALCDMLGYDEHELIGVDSSTWSPAEDSSRDRVARQQLVRGEIPAYEVEKRFRHRDGSLFWVVLNVTLMRSADGAPEFFITHVQNIDARKRIEQELLLAKDAAEAALKVKSSFLANMSHEIRTPLNGMFGALELLSHTSLSDEQTHLVQLGQTAGKSLLTLIDEILDLSRIEAGYTDLRPMTIELQRFVCELQDFFQPLVCQKRLAFDISIDKDLPQQLVADEVRLRQILLNLIGNAVKFTEGGGVSVLFGAVQPALGQGLRLRIDVTDTGCGMDQELVGRIFEPFVQGDDSFRKKYQGAGLGLAIVKRLADLMGGEVSVASTPGRGSTFTVILPFDLPPAATATAAMATAVQTPRTGGAKALRILLAEDNELNAVIIAKLLERNGHRVTISGNGEEVLELMAKEAFDLVLMDVQMPVLDGLETTARIRRDTSGRFNPQVPIVAMTAYAMNGDRERFLKAGMNDYLAKPVRKEKLFELLAGIR